jgi:biopolymer transport protein TolQ
MPFFCSTAYAAEGQFRGDVIAMVVDSDPIVKLVLLVLILFSIFSWGIVIQKWLALSQAKKKGKIILDLLAESGNNIADLRNGVDKTGENPLARMFQGAHAELRKVHVKGQGIPLAMLANVENRIKSESAQQTSELGRGLGFLASISNSSPFIGLFGTVWGIMDSFREIGMKGSANLATVAPGISEALIATAAGLFVAIPAVLFYNFFTSQMGTVSTQMERFEIDFMNWGRRSLVHDVD